ncbi:hypothetical protein F4777DRAFT_573387 [Nemania sp. FL0916]|nr:hypothetical protein F4777DRAFT_573387 [Nemania sp. FL0916]
MPLSRRVIIPRSQALSPGAVAGAVIGSLLGGSILLLVLGFLYFRYRRRTRVAEAEEALSVSEVPSPHHVNSFPQRDLTPPPRTGTFQFRRPPSVKSERNGRNDLAFPVDSSTQRSPESPDGDDWMRNDQAYVHQPDGFDTFPQGIDFTLPPRQQTFPIAAEHTIIEPLRQASTAPVTAPEAANSSYYDTRISMDSDPAQAITPPSMQMNEMYKAQVRAAEEHRRSNSLPKRIWNGVTRQWTRGSKGTTGDGAQSPSLQEQIAGSSVGYPVPIKQEPGQESSGGLFGPSIAPQYVEEPEQLTDDASNLDSHGPGSGREGEQRPQYGRYQPQTQDSHYGSFPGRMDSTIRETTEKDPALPSSVLTTDSTYGLPPAQPQTTSSERQERLKSPDIPEPMDIDGLQPQTNGHSPFRSSHSPQLSPDTFTINPMAILHPTNPTEQAAYTTYQIKHSASPPAMPTSAPEIITQQPTQEDRVDSPPPNEDDFAAMYLDLPSDDEYRRSNDSYEYSSTPGQSSTADSNGRTPDTRPTASPSPFPTIPEHGKLKPDPGVSPNQTRPSPQSGGLVCPKCGREFDQIHKLNHHKRYHDRTHECTYPGCDRKFGTKTHLDRHINDRHLKLKAYHCTEPTCAWFKGGKSFPRKDNWRRHMIKKHGSTPQDFDNMELSFG